MAEEYAEEGASFRSDARAIAHRYYTDYGGRAEAYNALLEETKDPFVSGYKEKMDALWLLSGKAGTAYKNPLGHLYEQTFFTNRATPEETERHLLKWYEPVSEEQRSAVLAKMKEELGDDIYSRIPGGGRILEEDFDGDRAAYLEAIEDQRREEREAKTGGDFYRWVAMITGGEKEASELLARAGIDGVKYPVDSYGKTVKDGDVAGWNYVSFRDDNIRVDHKWRDGEMVFQKAGEENKIPSAADGASQVSHPDMASIQTDEGAMLGRTAAENIAREVKKRKRVENELANYSSQAGRINPHHIVSELGRALGLKRNAPSLYRAFTNDDGTRFSVRVSNHRVNAANYPLKGGNEAFNLSIAVIRKNTGPFRPDNRVELREYEYREADLTDGDARKIAQALQRAMANGGKYADTTGKLVVMNPSHRTIDEKGNPIVQAGTDNDGTTSFRPQLRSEDEGEKADARGWDGARVEERTEKGRRRWVVLDKDGTVLESGLRSEAAALEVLERGRSRLDMMDGELGKLRKKDIAEIARARKALVESLANKQLTAEERVAQFRELARRVGIHESLAEKEWALAEKILS